jgi:hypothetical protein
MKKHLFTAFALAAMAAACTPGGKQLASGINLANLDTSYQPGTDFYMYATGGWQKDHPLTAEYSRFGSFDVLQEDNNERLRSLIEEVSAKENEKGSIEQKIADYVDVLNTSSINEDLIADMVATTISDFIINFGYAGLSYMVSEWSHSYVSESDTITAGILGVILFLLLIPYLVFSILVIVFCSKDGLPYPNEYGPSPKYIA